MRLATLLADDGTPSLGVVRDDRVLPIDPSLAGLGSTRDVAASGGVALARLGELVASAPATAWLPLAGARLGPAMPDPGAIYTVGQNYRAGADEPAPARPLVYGKLPTSVAAHLDTLTWDRSLTANVDAEVELGVVIGPATRGPVEPAEALGHVLGWTCINDVSSRDAWLDGDQWLLGKSMAGFCPVGPWIVTRDELDPSDVRLWAAINGERIQDGRTSEMRAGVAEIIAFLSRHTVLRPGDLIATGTPARLAASPGPERHLEPGDVVTIGIDGIGELTTHVG